MKSSFRFVRAVATGWFLITCLQAQTGTHLLDPLIVRGRRVTDDWGTTERIVGTERLRVQDGADLLKDLPGAAIVRNGPQTGIIQLRGLSGDRVAVQVDGMRITPACPNHMDPPLHYASPAGGELVRMFAGIGPVSEGGDSIGGSVSIARPDPEFAKGKELLLDGTLGAAWRGSQDAISLSADASVADANDNLRYRGAWATADDLRFPGGRVSDTSYHTTSHELVNAWRTPGGFLAVDLGFATTWDTGTPALPMDMINDDAWHFGLHQREALSWGTVENRLYVFDIDHLMDNYSFRPAAPAMKMKAPAASRDYGWRGEVLLPRGDSKLHAGLELHRAEFEARQEMVASGLWRDTFHDNHRSRAGAYLDWEQDWTAQWHTRIGLRTDVVASDAGRVSNGFGGAVVNADAALFNASDRTFTDALVDVMAGLQFKPDEGTSYELAFAIKNRAPSLVERYLWTPANASAGLADGRTYLGNLGLDPETSFQVGLGLAKQGEHWKAKVTPFYQLVDDYIQGLPSARLDAARQPVLQYQNIDQAELYGAEFVAGYDFNDSFSIDGTVSYVRGHDLTNGGNLYRIAPLRSTLDLSYRHEGWEGHLEWLLADRQDAVASVQGESPTPGYGLLNLRLAREFNSGLRIELGVENLLDKRYEDHLGGVNRVAASDVGIGQKIPGAGRFAYSSISWRF
ncbi:MAG: TonB-dependent receptor [Verrucomicrobia bacterium]|nr:TonB-dependent receptor [Verrucomicrobiota bacterium]